jgi:hypothetical protein
MTRIDLLMLEIHQATAPLLLAKHEAERMLGLYGPVLAGCRAALAAQRDMLAPSWGQDMKRMKEITRWLS